MNTARDEDATRSVLAHHVTALTQGLDEILIDYDDSSELITPPKSFRGRLNIRSFFRAVVT